MYWPPGKTRAVTSLLKAHHINAVSAKLGSLAVAGPPNENGAALKRRLQPFNMTMVITR